MTFPVIPFGREFKAKYFSNLDPHVINVNHGALGATPDCILDEYCKSYKSSQTFFDKYLRYEQRYEYMTQLKEISTKELLNCDFKNLAIVDSATAGVNTVLRSFPFKSGDKIVFSTTTYGACKKLIQFLERRIQIQPIVVDIKYPASEEEVVAAYETKFQEPGIRMCLMDAVTSVPGARIPFEEITKLCRKYKILSLIDAAHGIGLLKISLLDLKPDFFVTNLHKWFYVPKSCSVLYVNPEYHRVIQPLTISHQYSDEDVSLSTNELEQMRFFDAFQFTASRNKASIACITSAKKFRNETCGGEETIAKYCYELAWEAANHVTTKVWKGSSILNTKETATALINVEVPVQDLIPEVDINEIAPWLPQVEHEICIDYNTFVPCFFYEGKVYIRFSCQIYNELDDYIYAANAVSETFKKFFANIDKFKATPLCGSAFLTVEAFDKIS
ncbi:hypothetical protein CAAN3_04S06480 [[Candida] anglica]